MSEIHHTNYDYFNREGILNFCNRKPKIGLVSDTDDWALANVAKQIDKNLRQHFDFQRISSQTAGHIVNVLYQCRDCDIVHFLWRKDLLCLYYHNTVDLLKNIGIEYDTFRKNVINRMRFSTAVYDHLLLDEESAYYNRLIFGTAPKYYVSSMKLYDIYSQKTFCRKPMAVLEDGVDTKLFSPGKPERLGQIPGRELIVGWSGNSRWNWDVEDFKGVNTILKPALEQLRNEGHPVTYLFADRSKAFIPQEEMPEFYSKIDLYVCTSKTEGTPNPVLESMACGVPVITTDVGIVNQAFGVKQKEFILRERSVECLKEAIVRLLEHPGLLPELSDENLKQIKSWDWTVKAQGFKDFFDRCISYR